MNWILETERLRLREIEEEDYDALCFMLRDAEVMYAYEHAFSEEEAWDWLRRQRERYRRDGFGLWAVIRKADGVLIGQCGLTMQPWQGRMVPEVGYLFCKDVWHQGYATEAARAARDYAFSALGLEEVWSIIRVNNLPSRRVAERNGMQVRGQIVKHYYGMEMPHVGYSVSKGKSDFSVHCGG